MRVSHILYFDTNATLVMIPVYDPPPPLIKYHTKKTWIC